MEIGFLLTHLEIEACEAMRAIIIGLGQIGVGYDIGNAKSVMVATHARAINENSDIELVGGVDKIAENRLRFSEQYNKPAFKDIKEASGNLKAELIVIATPTCEHYNNIIEVILCMNPLVVVCEKPLAFSRQEAGEIVKACKESGTLLFVNYMRVSLPCVAEIERIFIKPSMRCANEIRGIAWYSGGLYNNGSHLINLLENWFGRVKGESRRLSTVKHLDRDVSVDLRLVFENASVYLLSDKMSYSTNSIELLSSLGELRYKDGGRYITISGCEQSREFKGYTYLSTDVKEIKSYFMHYQSWFYDALVKKVKGHEAKICSGEQALMTLCTIEKLTM